MTDNLPDSVDTTLERILFEYADGVETRLRILIATLRDGDEANAKLPKDVYVQLIYRIMKPHTDAAIRQAFAEVMGELPKKRVGTHTETEWEFHGYENFDKAIDQVLQIIIQKRGKL